MQAPVSASGAEQVAAAADKAEAPVSLTGAEHLAAAGEEKQPTEHMQGELTGHKEGLTFLAPSQTSVLQVTDTVFTKRAKETFAGQELPRSRMNSWRKLREQHPELFSASSALPPPVWGHPCAYQDEVIRDWQASSEAGEEGEGLLAQQEMASSD